MSEATIQNVKTDIQEVLHSARKLAIDAGNPTIESEHALMAIIQTKGPGYTFLAKQIALPGLVTALKKTIASNSSAITVEGDLLISNSVTTALTEVHQLSYADSKDLLLALYRQKNTTASILLDRFNFNERGVGAGPETKSVGAATTGNGSTPALDAFSDDLTKAATEGRLDPIVNRTTEIGRISQILGRRKKNNPVLIGEPGVGKSAIVEGLAMKIAKGEAAEALQGKRIISLNLSAVVAGTKLRGQFEERMKAIIDELVREQDIIVFIDEIHTLVGSGGPEGTGDASNMLKPALARGDIQCIGATTYDDYRKYIEKDPALARRFQMITVDPPSLDETKTILSQIKGLYEKHHQIQYADNVVEVITALSDRYVADRFMPDKAIDVLDEAGSMVRLAGSGVVTEDDIRKVISTMTGVPVTSIGQSERDRLKTLSLRMEEGIIGQNKAIEVLTKAVKRARTGIKSVKKPFTALLLGPTGVGKTETAKQLARCLFDTEDALIRVDMSELAESHSIAKLIGAPPGYVGYDQGGNLTEQVRKKPYSIILLDEVEKAHPDVFNVFLQVFDDGQLTDGRGKTVDFRNTIILMTSNIGAREATKPALGFGEIDAKATADEKRNDALKQYFRPEFLNRIDEIVYFDSLNADAVRKILSIYLKEIQNVTVRVSEEAMTYLITNGYSKEFGARPLRRLVQDKIESPIADALLDNEHLTEFDVVMQGDNIVVQLVKEEQTNETVSI